MSTAAFSQSVPSRRALHVVLWVAQVLLAVAFGVAGTMRLTQPAANLAAMMPWTAAVPLTLVRFIGTAELSGALGLLLPSLSRVQPRLTALAALGLVVVMAMAAVFHLSRGEAAMLAPNLVLGGLAAFVTWGRGTAAPIAPRSR